MRALPRTYYSLFLAFLIWVSAALAAPAFAQTNDEAWFTRPVFFNDLTPAVQKCVEAQVQSRDRSRAYRELLLCSERLSASGDRSADLLVGYFYWRGWYTPVNHEAAANLWERSYEGGHVNAAIFLALPYAQKLGRPKDLEKARALRRQFALKTQQPVEEFKIAGTIDRNDTPCELTRWLRCKFFIGIVNVSYTVERTGAVSTCLANGGDENANKVTCKLIVSRFKFLPALSQDGVEIGTKRTQNMVWDKTPYADYFVTPSTQSKGQAKLEAGLTHPGNSSSEAASLQPSDAPKPAISKDQNLETAIERCRRIGFKENEPGYRECVLEQIRLLSNVK